MVLQLRVAACPGHRKAHHVFSYLLRDMSSPACVPDSAQEAKKLTHPLDSQAPELREVSKMPKEKGAPRKTKRDGAKRKKGITIPIIPSAERSPDLYSCEILDPNAPKRGLSAYMFFANEQRDKVREENPGIKFGELL